MASQLVVLQSTNPVEELATTFFQSKNVKIFPCAYRGYYGSKVFDPEARSFTESNYSNIYTILREGKKSYVIDWYKGDSNGEGSVLKCLLGGHYFEFYNLILDDFWDSTTKKVKGIAIRLKKEPINDNDYEPDSKRYTYILQSLYGVRDALDANQIHNTLYLDSALTTSGSTYIFTGACVISHDDASSFDYYIEPFTLKADVAASEATSEDLVYNWKYRSALEILDTDDATGKYSLRNRGEANADYSQATGEYAIAFGKGTKATKNQAVAFGYKTEANGENSFAIGTEAKAMFDKSMALGESVITKHANQTVLGKYNVQVDEAPFIIGWGTASALNNILVLKATNDYTSLILDGKETNNLILGSSAVNRSGTLTIYNNAKKAIFTVDASGNVKAAGTLETGAGTEIKSTLTLSGKATLKDNVDILGYTEISKYLIVKGANNNGNSITAKGNIISDGNSNLLQLGNATTNGYSGAIDVYGTGAAKVFSVTNAGVVSIASTLTAGGTTLSTLTVNGTTTLKNRLNAEAKTVICGTTATADADNTSTDALIVHGTSTLDGAIKISGNVTCRDVVGTAFSLTGTTPKASITSAGALTCHNSITLNGTSGEGDAATTIEILKADSTHLRTVGYVEATALKMPIGEDTFSTITYDSDKDVITTTHGLSIAGSIKNSGTLDIFGATTLRSTLEVFNAVTIGGATEITGDLTLKYKSGALVTNSILFDVANSKITCDTIELADTITADRIILTGEPSNEDPTAGIVDCAGVNSSGRVMAEFFLATSDSRKKTNIVDYHCEKSILDLPIKEFEYINDGTHTKHIGCLAQDLQQIAPELVYTDTDGYLAIEENKLVYLLLQEVKALRKEIKTLKGE